MCDYCDCRSHPQIAALAAEHEQALARTAAIRRAVATAADPGELVARLAAELPPHFDREERGVFRQMRASGIGEDYVDTFDREHDELEALLAAEVTPAVATRLVELLEDHILREETDMFPAAHQLFAPTDWDEIDAEVGRPTPSEGVLRAAIEPPGAARARPGSG